jgi:hypothetical protein
MATRRQDIDQAEQATAQEPAKGTVPPAGQLAPPGTLPKLSQTIFFTEKKGGAQHAREA